MSKIAIYDILLGNQYCDNDLCYLSSTLYCLHTAALQIMEDAKSVESESSVSLGNIVSNSSRIHTYLTIGKYLQVKLVVRNSSFIDAESSILTTPLTFNIVFV